MDRIAKRPRMRLAALGIIACLVGAAHAAQPRQVADIVIEWNTLATNAVEGITAASPPGLPPYVEARLYAMTFVAMHDSLNAVQRRFAPYACETRQPGASPTAAAATAAHDVLVALLPGAASTFDAAYATQMADEPDAGRPRHDAGVQLGQRCAAAILGRRANDGAAAALEPYVPDAFPGAYRPTFPFDQPELPPGTPFPLYGFVADPQWVRVKPFVLDSGAQFRAPPPYTVVDIRYAIDVDEVQRYGAAVGSARTADQDEIALFWKENSPLGWNRVARGLAQARRLDGWEAARLFALLQLAEADAYLTSFDSKYHYRFWRPYTANRLADLDANPFTHADPNWMPFDPVTPPVPDYTSAHSAAGGAARAVLSRFFGTDAVSFDLASTTLPGTTRHYASFTEAADENGLSRILIGYHFRLAVEAGRRQGESVGAWVFEHALVPWH